MKESVSVYQHIISTGLKYLTPMFLSIDMMVHFVLNALMEFKEQNQPSDNIIDSLMQWLQLLDIRKKTIIHAMYIKVLYDVTVSYPKVSTDDVLNTTNNKTEFTELRRVFKKILRLKSKKNMSLST